MEKLWLEQTFRINYYLSLDLGFLVPLFLDLAYPD